MNNAITTSMPAAAMATPAGPDSPRITQNPDPVFAGKLFALSSTDMFFGAGLCSHQSLAPDSLRLSETEDIPYVIATGTHAGFVAIE